MGRPRTAKHSKPESRPEPQHIEPENESQEQPDGFETHGTEPANDDFKLQPDNGQTVSKADMVRQVLAEGITTPPEGVARIKQLFGIELPKPMWSSYVAGEKRRQGGETQPRSRTAPAPQAFGIPADFGSDVRLVKELIEQAGSAEKLKDLAGSISTLERKYGVAGMNSLIDAFGD